MYKEQTYSLTNVLALMFLMMLLRRERLPKLTYKALKQTIDEGDSLVLVVK